MSSSQRNQISSQKIVGNFSIGIIAIIIIAFSFGVWYWLRTNTPGSGLGTDAKIYGRLAVAIIENRWADYRGTVFPPIYPIFLAVLYRIVGEPSVVAASIANIAVFSLIAGAASGVGYRYYGLMGGVFSGVFIAINPNLLFYANIPLTEMLFTLILLLAAIILQMYGRDYSLMWLIFASVLVGLGILTRVAMYYYLPPIILWLLYTAKGRIPKRIIPVSVFIAVVLLLIVPWTIIAAQLQNESTGWFGMFALHHGNRLAYYEALKEYLFESGTTFLTFGVPDSSMTNLERIREIVDFIITSPQKWVHLYFLKLYYHLQFFNLKDIPSTKIAIWSTGYWLIIWPLVIFNLLKSRKAWRTLIVWLIAANLLLHPLGHISRYHRYRIPIEPLIVLFAAGGLSMLLPIISKNIAPIWAKFRNFKENMEAGKDSVT